MREYWLETLIPVITLEGCALREKLLTVIVTVTTRDHSHIKGENKA